MWYLLMQCWRYIVFVHLTLRACDKAYDVCVNSLASAAGLVVAQVSTMLLFSCTAVVPSLLQWFVH